MKIAYLCIKIYNINKMNYKLNFHLCFAPDYRRVEPLSTLSLFNSQQIQSISLTSSLGA